MNKTELESQLQDLRTKYRAAQELRADDIVEELRERGLEIRRKIDKTHWCHVCGNLPCSYNEYYCSVECQDKLYPPKRSYDFKKLIRARSVEIGKINENK